jgi:FkbM family methyltransferase
VLDIGANYGEVALAAASRVGPRGRVHAFEPNSRIGRFLKVSAELNGFTNLSVHEIALGNSDRVAELAVPEGNTGAGSLTLRSDSRESEGAWSETVRIVDAGKFLGSLNLSSVDVVKIDVEGMEAEVFESMQWLLRKFRPRLIIFESHDEIPFFERDSVKILLGLGYSFSQLVVDRRLATRPKTVPIKGNGDVRSGYDFLATPN